MISERESPTARCPVCGGDVTKPALSKHCDVPKLLHQPKLPAYFYQNEPVTNASAPSRRRMANKIESPTPEHPSTEAVMRARAVLRAEIERLRSKAAIWGVSGATLVSDADELESVRRHLLPMDYPSIIEAENHA